MRKTQRRKTRQVMCTLIAILACTLLFLEVFGLSYYLYKVNYDIYDTIPFKSDYVTVSRKSSKLPVLVPISEQPLIEEERKKAEREKAEREKAEREKEEAEKIFLETIAKIVYREAAGETFEGKVCVAATIVNRLASPNFPDTLEEVIEAYAPIENLQIMYHKSWDECLKASQEAIDGADPLAEMLGGPTTSFYNPNLSEKLEIESREILKENGVTMVKIGAHVFYADYTSELNG